MFTLLQWVLIKECLWFFLHFSVCLYFIQVRNKKSLNENYEIFIKNDGDIITFNEMIDKVKDLSVEKLVDNHNLYVSERSAKGGFKKYEGLVRTHHILSYFDGKWNFGLKGGQN